MVGVFKIHHLLLCGPNGKAIPSPRGIGLNIACNNRLVNSGKMGKEKGNVLNKEKYGKNYYIKSIDIG